MQLFFLTVTLLTKSYLYMPKKAIIYDLDNTLYPVSAIGEKLYGPVFNTIIESGLHDDELDEIKKGTMRTPFRLIAEKHNFSPELTRQCIAIQEQLTYNEPIATFEDYPEIATIPGERFLVTTGFKTLQNSKIKQMGIAQDFKEIHIVDPLTTSKKEVFEGILTRYNYSPGEVLVVGDDPESEIAAAKALGIPTVLYDKLNTQNAASADYKINHFKDLKDIYLTT